MANRWVEFVRKWAKDNNMNYMCAMTTKECKDAYLKAYPKLKPGGLKGLYDDPEGKYSIDVDGLLDMIEGLLGDISNLGTDSWSGSTDNIIRLAKKHKVNISKFLSKEDAGWYQEYDTIENILDGFKGKGKNYSNRLHFFLQDLFELLEGYRSKGEQMGMAEADVPAPAPPPAKKKVVIKVPKKTKKAVMGETNTQPELVKMILDDMKKSGVKMDTGDRTIIRKQKPDIKKVEDRLDAGEDIREELKGLVDLYDKELLGMKDSKKVEELVEKFNIKKRAEKAKKKGE